MEKDGILEYYREKLEDILSNPKLNEFDGIPSKEAKRVALRLAVTLGYCNIFGAFREIYVLPVPEAIGATAALIAAVYDLANLVEDKISDPTKLDKIEDIDQATDIVTARLDIYAALITIHDAYKCAVDEFDPDAEALRELLEAAEDAVEHLDDVLGTVEAGRLLTPVKSTYILANWQALADERYTQALPAWLLELMHV